MSTDLNYIYFGSALAVSASVARPVRDFLTEQTSVVLAPSGGYAVQTREQTNFRDIVRTGRVHVTVVGNADSPDYFSTLATVTVEKLNILGFITADAIVSRVAARYPKDAPDNGIMHPTVFFFHGSAFHGLRIDNRSYAPAIADPAVHIPQDRDLNPIYEVAPGHGYVLRANSVGSKRLFTGFEHKRPDEPLLEFAEFGRIFLGELNCYKGKATLTMLRVELGSAIGGSITCASASSNGHPPPGGHP